MLTVGSRFGVIVDIYLVNNLICIFLKCSCEYDDLILSSIELNIFDVYYRQHCCKILWLRIALMIWEFSSTHALRESRVYSFPTKNCSFVIKDHAVNGNAVAAFINLLYNLLLFIKLLLVYLLDYFCWGFSGSLICSWRISCILLGVSWFFSLKVPELLPFVFALMHGSCFQPAFLVFLPAGIAVSFHRPLC